MGGGERLPTSDTPAPQAPKPFIQGRIILPHYVLLEVQNGRCLDSRGENSVSCLRIRVFGTPRPFTHTPQCFFLPASLSWRIFVEKVNPSSSEHEILPPLPPTLPRRLCVLFWFFSPEVFFFSPVGGAKELAEV